jgi:hypothetical protein
MRDKVIAVKNAFLQDTSNYIYTRGFMTDELVEFVKQVEDFMAAEKKSGGGKKTTGSQEGKGPAKVLKATGKANKRDNPEAQPKEPEPTEQGDEKTGSPEPKRKQRRVGKK